MEEKIIKPIHDEKTDKILAELSRNNRSRRDVAEEMGYKTYKSLDMYMRRRNWRWNSKTENYEAEVPKLSFEENINKLKTTGTTIGRVIELFNSGLDDPREIAKQAGFKDHVEMAESMKRKNYLWNSEANNYVMLTGLVEDDTETSEDNIASNQSINTVGDDIDLNQLIPLLQALQNNLTGLPTREFQSQVQSIPTYLVPGSPTSITIQMMTSIKLLLREYSNEYNITQRKIVEVAILEFMTKFGYDYKVKSILNG